MTADIINFNEVYEIESLIDSIHTQRIVEMGCVPGVKITKTLQAPLGDPIAYSIDNAYILSLRKEEAKNIVVRKLVN